MMLQNSEQEYILANKIKQLQALSIILEEPGVPFVSISDLSKLIDRLRMLSTGNEQCQSEVAHVLACIYKTHSVNLD